MISLKRPEYVVADWFNNIYHIVQEKPLPEEFAGELAHELECEMIENFESKNFIYSSKISLPPEVGSKLAEKLFNNFKKHYTNDYKKIRDNFCGYCGIRNAETLDHYKEKAVFPLLSVTPANLVPACFACNNKLASASTKYNPYFDSNPPDGWLVAKLSAGDPPGVIFEVDADAFHSNELFARVSTVFLQVELAHRWSMEFAPQLTRWYAHAKSLENEARMYYIQGLISDADKAPRRALALSLLNYFS